MNDSWGWGCFACGRVEVNETPTAWLNGQRLCPRCYEPARWSRRSVSVMTCAQRATKDLSWKAARMVVRLVLKGLN